MDAKAAVDLAPLTAGVLQAEVDFLAVTVFGDPAKDAVFKTLDSALGGVLADVAKSESFEGKANQGIVVHTHGKIPARRVMVLGAGPRGEFQNPQTRDLAASAVQAATKASAASVAFVLPQLGANREALLVQLVTEGVLLGTYKFGRYLTGEEHKRPSSLEKVGVILDVKGKKISATQTKAFAAAVARR